MENQADIKQHQLKLQSKYKRLIEQAYNVRQTDSALSDIWEYKAIRILDKLNRLRFLNRDIAKPSF